MIYLKPGDFEIGFFRKHGWLVVENAIGPDIVKTEFRTWMRSFGSALMGSEVEF